MASKSAATEDVIKTRLSEIMEDWGISQYRLAKHTGMAYLTINQYFHNKSAPSLTTLYRIAEALNEIAKSDNLKDKRGRTREIHPKDLLL